MLEARVALSTVDVDGARGNLAAEGGKRFDAVRADAGAEWNRLLNRIIIDAPDRQKRIFYSALYRALMHPSDIADADGRVRGPTGQVIAARGGSYYSTLSLWDTFRAAQPLLTLIAPERVGGIINTLLDHHKAQGYLPLWTSWGRETHTMIGNPALPVIADALAKDFRGFDRNEALAAMVATSTAARPRAPEWAQRDWSAYEEFGYVPLDRVSNEAVSLTLEYGIGDDAVARVARALGQGEVAMRFSKRAQGYRQLFDSETKMMRGRDSKGAWRTPFDPLAATSPLNNPGDYTEANAWQYTLTPALHDPEGLRTVMGGSQALGEWLDRFFSTSMPKADKHLGQEAMIGQYAHGNEPSHHIAYLYAWSDRPWKTGELVRRIMRDFYTDQPNGIIGNDDCGQMSAWYVLSTLGIYPVVPASGTYALGAPQVRRASVLLGSGRMLLLTLDGNAVEGTSIRATLNGIAVNPIALDHAQLVTGGTLAFARR
jgi:predicted alpha-1,2-mannosidase